VTDGPPLHEVLAPLRGLVGTFAGDGAGEYPTIEPFTYREQVTFGHVGKPFLAYTQRTAHPATGSPMHAEAGYLRLVPDGRLELVLAHPTGITEVEEGSIEVEGDTVTLELATTHVGTTATAKDVRALRRTFTLSGDTLRYELAMAHADTPLTHHLAAVLHRAPS
jgi:uncharacterized protein YndB with AHSA1/START domain